MYTAYRVGRPYERDLLKIAKAESIGRLLNDLQEIDEASGFIFHNRVEYQIFDDRGFYAIRCRSGELHYLPQSSPHFNPPRGK